MTLVEQGPLDNCIDPLVSTVGHVCILGVTISLSTNDILRAASQTLADKDKASLARYLFGPNCCVVHISVGGVPQEQVEAVASGAAGNL